MSHGLPLCVALAATTILLPSRAMGFGYLDAYRGGTPHSGAGTYSAGLGGAVSTHDHDAFALFLNPAGLSSLDDWSVSVTGGGLNWLEVRVYGISRMLRSDRAKGTSGIAGSIPIGAGFTFGAGMASVADAAYIGARMCIDPYTGEVRSQEVLNASGVQWDAAAGISYELPLGVSAGISAGWRTGTISLDYYRFDNFLGQIDSVMNRDIEVSEPAIRAGLMKISGISTLGVSYSAGGDCLAPVLSGGFRFLAPHIQNTRVGFEADLSSPLARNDFEGKLMIEFPMTSTTTLLSGVSFSDSPKECGSGMGFSLGGSQRIGVVDVQAALHWRNRRLEGLYVPHEDANRVEETLTEFVVGVSLNP